MSKHNVNTMLTKGGGHSFKGLEEEEEDTSGSEVEVDEEMDGLNEFRSRHSHRKRTRREIFKELLEMLDGTEVNRMLAVVSFALACCAELFGIFSPLEHIEGCYRSFTFLSAVFLVNQSFFYVKNLRDTDLRPRKNKAGKVSPEVHFVRGAMPGKSAPHDLVCRISLVLSLAATVAGILTMDAKRHTQLFIGLSTLFMMSSSLNLAMMMRDRFEGQIWEGELHERHITSKGAILAVENVVLVLQYHHVMFKFLFFLVGASALGITVFAMIDFGLKEKGIGLLSAGMVMSGAAGWNLARVLNMSKEDAHKAHHSELSVFVSFIIAITLTTIGLVLIDLPLYKRIVLALGIVIFLDATFNFAKVEHRYLYVKKHIKYIKAKFHTDVLLDVEEQNCCSCCLPSKKTSGENTARGVMAAASPTKSAKGGTKKSGQ